MKSERHILLEHSHFLSLKSNILLFSYPQIWKRHLYFVGPNCTAMLHVFLLIYLFIFGPARWKIHFSFASPTCWKKSLLSCQPGLGSCRPLSGVKFPFRLKSKRREKVKNVVECFDRSDQNKLLCFR